MAKLEVRIVQFVAVLALGFGARSVYQGCQARADSLDDEQRKALSAHVGSDERVYREPLLGAGAAGNAIDVYTQAMKLTADGDESKQRDQRVAALVVEGASRRHRQGWTGERAITSWSEMVTTTRALRRAAARKRALGDASTAAKYLVASHRLWQDLAHSGPSVYAVMGAREDLDSLAEIRDMHAKGELNAATRRLLAEAYARLVRTRTRATQIVRNEIRAMFAFILVADAKGGAAWEGEMVGGMKQAAAKRGGGLRGMARVTDRLRQLAGRHQSPDGISSHYWGRSFVRGCVRELGHSHFCDGVGSAVSGNELRNAEFRILAAEFRLAR